MTNSAKRIGIFVLSFITLMVLSTSILFAQTKRENLLAPTLGTYPNTTVDLGSNAFITPANAPTGALRTTARTSTSFKGLLEVSPTTGSIRITNAHQAGTFLITITAFDASNATVTATFTLTVRAFSGCMPVTFGALTTYTSNGSTEQGIAVGDFNGDGFQDLVTPNRNTGQVVIFQNNGNGTFFIRETLNFTSGLNYVAVGDFNGDGWQDLAVTSSSGQINIYRNSANPGSNLFLAFPPTTLTGPQDAFGIAVGDFNNDGNKDLAVALYPNPSRFEIFIGNGTGGFSSATVTTLGTSGSHKISVGDFNSDNNDDLVVNNINSNVMTVMLGAGNGTFGAATNFSTLGSSPYSTTIGDFNNDGKQDLAIPNAGNNNFSVLNGNGLGSFGTATTFAAGAYPFSNAVGDFNGDGNQDLVTTNLNSTNASITLGNGTGSFGAPINFSHTNLPFNVAVGDFNNDGRQDYSTINLGGTLDVRMRQCAGSITTTTLPNANTQLAYNQTVNATGGTAPYTFSVTGGTLPPGIMLSNSFSSFGKTDESLLVGNLTGMSTSGGTYNFTITATDSVAPTPNTFSRNYTIQVFAPTSASANVSGRVSQANGAGISKARVVLTDSQGNEQTAATNSFGVYSFSGIPVGANYVLQVTNKKYSFSPQVVFVAEDTTVNFNAGF